MEPTNGLVLNGSLERPNAFHLGYSHVGFQLIFIKKWVAASRMLSSAFFGYWVSALQNTLALKVIRCTHVLLK